MNNQGANASKIFKGDTITMAAYQAYANTIPMFADIISSEFEPGKYSLLEIGGYDGGFLKKVIDGLPEYTFDITTVDMDEDALASHFADKKLIGKIQEQELPKHSYDIILTRYVLPWNSLSGQVEIIQQIKILGKGICIIQHQGSDDEGFLQKASKELFSGVIPSLKRDDFYFSTKTELQEIFEETGIEYEEIQSEYIRDLSNIYIEKYDLNNEDASKTKEILGRDGYDGFTSTTYLLKLG